MTHQQVIKNKNKKNLYNIISNNEGISRARLASKTKLSKSTVSLLVDELINEKMLVDIGTVESGIQGRKPNGLVVNKDRFILVVNIMKKSVEIDLVTLSYEVRENYYYTYKGKIYVKYLSDIIIESLKKYSSEILGVCIVLPAIIDNVNRSIITMVLDMEKNETFIDDLRDYIPQQYGLAFFNDTTSLAYAENTFGSVESANYAYININEGVGASYIHDSKILRGTTGLAMQLGHMSIKKDGVPCSCGNRGCLENYIGELSLRSRAIEYGLIDKNFDSDFLFRDLEEMSSKGDQKADTLIYALADELSDALGKIIVILNPEIIVIGGIGRKLGEKYLNRIQANIKSNGFIQFCKNINIKYTKLNDSAIFIGAAKYYIDKHFDFSRNAEGDLFLS